MGTLPAKHTWRTFDNCSMSAFFLSLPESLANRWQSIDFIVPDYQLQAAAKVLSDSDTLEPCPDINVCLAGPHNRCTPPAAHHVHVHGSEITVEISIQSETLWFLPELDQSLVFPPTLDLHPYFVFDSDKHTLPLNDLVVGQELSKKISFRFWYLEPSSCWRPSYASTLEIVARKLEVLQCK